MKRLLLCLSFFILFFSSTHSVTMTGQDDLPAYQIFETHNKNQIKSLYKKLSRKFHPDRYKGSQEVFKVISNAYHDIMDDDKGPLSPVPNSKDIFYNIIKPYLDELLMTEKLEKAKALNDEFKEELRNLDHPPLIKLRDVNKVINQLKKIPNQVSKLKKLLLDITNYQYENIEPAKLKEFLINVQKFQFLSAEELQILTHKVQMRISELNPTLVFWKKFYPILLLDDLVNGKNELLKKMFQENEKGRFFFPEELGAIPAAYLIKDLRDNDVVTPEGDIKSFENAYRLLLKFIKEIENDFYLKEDTPQAQSILKEVKNLEATFKAHLNKPDFMQVLPALYSTLEALALVKDNLNID